MLSNLGGGRRRLAAHEDPRGGQLLTEERRAGLGHDDELKSRALANAEQNGIVFLERSTRSRAAANVGGPDVSRQGVQRDLLPLVEGTTVSTRYGMVKTDHILFHRLGRVSPRQASDLIPELQGRFPIRVELRLAVGRGLRAHPGCPPMQQVKQYRRCSRTEA